MVDANGTCPLGVEVTSSTEIFPKSRQYQPTTTPLSIIDSTVSYFARCAGIWFYDPPTDPSFALSVSQLQESLSQTLNSYRPWCGRLSYVVPKPNGGHTNRYRRLHVTYDAPTDLGVNFNHAKSPKILLEYLPSASGRKTSQKAWDLSQLPSGELLPKTGVALSSKSAPVDAPNMMVQVTTFACGSTAIGIAITHGLSDAQSMCTFAKDWASNNRAIQSSSPLPTLSPVFNPVLLDSAAAGNIDSETPDPRLIDESRNLPQHRFDWYKGGPGQEWTDRTPDDFDRSAILSPSEAIPWHDWDMSLPEAGRVLHFTPTEIQTIFKAANTDPASKISKHDAILAHMWSLINRARQITPQETTYLDLTLGLRPRLGLPQNFLGSPITLAAIPFPSSSDSSPPSVATIASAIRSTLQLFTPSAIAAHLHDCAFEVSPQRLWRAFLGKKHILQTTWVQSGFQDVDFVGKGGPELRYVQPEMGGDGLLLVMEALDEKGGEKGHWTANGVDVYLFLEKGAMERLLVDPGLWGEALISVER